MIALQMSGIVDSTQRSIEPVQQRFNAMRDKQADCSPQVAQGFQVKIADAEVSKVQMATGFDDWLSSQGCWLRGRQLIWATGVVEVGNYRGLLNGEFDVTQLTLGVERPDGVSTVRGLSVGFGTTDTVLSYQSAESHAKAVTIQTYRNRAMADHNWSRWLLGITWLNFELERTVTQERLNGRRDGLQLFGHFEYENRVKPVGDSNLSLLGNVHSSLLALGSMRESGGEAALSISPQTAWHIGGEIGLKLDSTSQWHRWLVKPSVSTLILVDYRDGSRYRFDEAVSGNSWEASYTPSIVTGWDMQLGIRAKSGRSDWGVDLAHGLDETRRRSRVQATYQRHLLDDAGLLSWSLGHSDRLPTGLSARFGFTTSF